MALAVKKESKMKNEMMKNAYYPVLFVWVDGKVKKVVNPNAPYYTVGEALRHAAEANYPVPAEPGYARWNGSKWVADTWDNYEEAKMECDPDYVSRQMEAHMIADRRLDNEARGFY